MSNVLYVSDNKRTGRVMSRYLLDEGYNVLSAEDAPKALMVFREFPDAFDLVVVHMDTRGPLSGNDFRDQITQVRDVPVILCTSQAGSHEEPPSGEFAGILMIPYSPSDLTRMIKQVEEKGRSED